jgi:hypothetical protein
MKTFSSYKDKLNNNIYLFCRNSIFETTDVAKSQVDIMKGEDVRNAYLSGNKHILTESRCA